ncbi:MAG TPA: class I lanthipeptide [Thermoanaerobaculia bacterium]|nr:class I lanthipeptide [Thermoanaerobaculia bacterium]
MKKRAQNKKLSLSKETILHLMTAELRFVAGRGSDCVETKEDSRGDYTVCECSGGGTTTFHATVTCNDCSTIQW